MSTAMNGPEFTAKIVNLLFEGMLDEARALLDAAQVLPKSEYHRITKAKSLIDDIAALERKAASPNLKRVVLKEFPQETPVPVADDVNFLQLDYGLYTVGLNRPRKNSFEEDFCMETDEVRDLLRANNFGENVKSRSAVKIRVFEDAVCCAADRSLYACVSMSGFYDRAASARMAKSSAVNFLQEPISVLDEAFVLPASHHVRNYYHAVSEMAYYIRYAENCDAPIVYSEDCFGAVRFLAEKLNIEKSRLLSFSDVQGILIKKAAMPIPTAYFWGEDVFDFFQGLMPAAASPCLGLYLSRAMGTRGPVNESEVERWISSRGFLVVHPQFLSLEAQSLIFASAKIVVAPHGAGLTNMAYMRRGTALVELFEDGFVSRDFYLRSRHNAMKYRPLIHGNGVDIYRLESIIDDILSTS